MGEGKCWCGTFWLARRAVRPQPVSGSPKPPLRPHGDNDVLAVVHTGPLYTKPSPVAISGSERGREPEVLGPGETIAGTKLPAAAHSTFRILRPTVLAYVEQPQNSRPACWPVLARRSTMTLPQPSPHLAVDCPPNAFATAAINSSVRNGFRRIPTAAKFWVRDSMVPVSVVPDMAITATSG